jgi:CHAT domain-containing protein
VLVAPDGALCLVPLAALPGKRPGSYLLEDVAVGTVGSGRHALEIFSKRPAVKGNGLLAVGGIDYRARLSAGQRRQPAASRRAPLDADTRAGFASLPGTELEARRIQTAFRRVFPKARAVLLTRADPHERRIKKELSPAETARRWRYLHFAGHGFFAPPTVRSALRPDTGGAAPFSGLLSGQEARTVGLNPLLLSGLVLAGANRAHALDEEDGILTAEEVYGLDLRGTELVVLSACDTGLGEVAGGEGVLGLQRAFQVAGARTLVTSLWKVDDAATTLLMEEFYANLWARKLPKLEALRRAQLTVLAHPERIDRRRRLLKKEAARRGLDLRESRPLPKGGRAKGRSHPVLWAAFVLSGEVR